MAVIRLILVMILVTACHNSARALDTNWPHSEYRQKQTSVQRTRPTRKAQRTRKARIAPAQAPVSVSLTGVPVLGAVMSMLGMHEHRHRGALRAKIGVDPVRVPWCGFFVSWAVKQAGRTPPPSPGWAPNWVRYGTPVPLASAQPGDIVVTGSRGGHVGVFHSRRGGRVCIAGGNQSNAVTVTCVSARSIVGVRR